VAAPEAAEPACVFAAAVAHHPVADVTRGQYVTQLRTLHQHVCPGETPSLTFLTNEAAISQFVSEKACSVNTKRAYLYACFLALSAIEGHNVLLAARYQETSKQFKREHDKQQATKKKSVKPQENWVSVEQIAEARDATTDLQYTAAIGVYTDTRMRNNIKEMSRRRRGGYGRRGDERLCVARGRSGVHQSL
jgi:hypothetical protein